MVLRDIITKNTKENVEFKNDDNIFKLGFVNSMFAMKIIHFIEQQYDIKVPDDDLDIKNFRSVDLIASYVGKKLKNKS